MALILHFLGLFLIFCAWGLLVIVSVSVPIWNQIDFLNALDRSYLLGIWGATIQGQTAIRTYGYEAVAAAGGREIILMRKGLSYGLLLNPIAAFFAGWALLAALFTNTACGILASVLAFWAFIVTLAAMAYDLGVFIRARNQFNDLVGNGAGGASLGKAMWFVVAACGALFLASFLVCFTHSSHKRRKAERDVETRPLNDGRRGGLFSRRSRTSHDETLVGDEQPMVAEKKHHFWQRKQQQQEPVVVDQTQPVTHTAY